MLIILAFFISRDEEPDYPATALAPREGRNYGSKEENSNREEEGLLIRISFHNCDSTTKNKKRAGKRKRAAKKKRSIYCGTSVLFFLLYFFACSTSTPYSYYQGCAAHTEQSELSFHSLY